MISPVRIGVTLAIFVVTMVLVLTRPRGWHEAWWTILGATAVVILGFVTPREIAGVLLAAENALLFLFALLLLSKLLERSGFFDWAAMEAARRSNGNGHALYRNVFALGAVTTIMLSLDTTAVILTPIVLAFVSRLELRARPFVVTCALVANIASLALPVSNLTNLIVADAFHLQFTHFAIRMIGPQVVALLVAYFLLRRRFRAEVPATFDATRLETGTGEVAHRGFFLASVITFGLVLVGYFVVPFLGVEPYVVGFLGAFGLGIAGVRSKRVRPRHLAEISWGIFPFVLGLFVVVQSIENLGLVAAAARWIGELPRSPLARILLAAGLTGGASNVMNNLPAVLVARSALQASHADLPTVLGTLVGVDLGPNVLPMGSLATMLVLGVARTKGEKVSAFDVMKVGAWITPLVMLAACLALAATYAIVP